MSGKAIIFSAPSGAGKTTIVHSLLDRITNLRFSISATTRPKRSTEVDGRDYYFLSLTDFEKRREDGDLLEWEEVYEGVCYGTLKSEVERIWSDGNHVIFDVDVKGGIKLKSILGRKALSVFIKVQSVDVLRERLEKRNTESQAMLEERVSKAAIEMEEAIHFDKVIVNDELESAIQEAEDLVTTFIMS